MIYFLFNKQLLKLTTLLMSEMTEPNETHAAYALLALLIWAPGCFLCCGWRIIKQRSRITSSRDGLTLLFWAFTLYRLLDFFRNDGGRTLHSDEYWFHKWQFIWVNLYAMHLLAALICIVSSDHRRYLSWWIASAIDACIIASLYHYLWYGLWPPYVRKFGYDATFNWLQAKGLLG